MGNLGDQLASSIYKGSGLLFTKTITPATPDATEAARIPTFAVSSNGASPKARFAMKSDMVNPIPASMPTARICRQLELAGMAASFVRVANQENVTMPMGLPQRTLRCKAPTVSTPPSAALFPIYVGPPLLEVFRATVRAADPACW